jgi:hypothetical protein
LTRKRAKLTRRQRRTHDLLTRFASALRALAKRIAICMSRFAGHANSSLYIYVVTHRGIDIIQEVGQKSIQVLFNKFGKLLRLDISMGPPKYQGVYTV